MRRQAGTLRAAQNRAAGASPRPTESGYVVAPPRTRRVSAAAVLFLHELFQRREAAAHLFGPDAVGHAEIPRAAETVAGHQRQVILHGLAAEGVGVRFQRFGEDVEGAVRLV